MADFLIRNQIYIVLIIVLIIWIGLIIYIFILEKKVKDLEKKITMFNIGERKKE